MSTGKNRANILKLAQFSILLAIEIIVCFTPLGTIPIPGIPATLSHIPVIITAIVLGPYLGALMGFFFGLFSFIVMTFIAPGVGSLLFTPFYSIGEISGSPLNLITCFIPRILLGLIAGALFKVLTKWFSNDKLSISLAVSGLVATILHTVLVLGLAYLIIGRNYVAGVNIAAVEAAKTTGETAALMDYSGLLAAFGGVVLTNGVMEALVAVFSVALICPPLIQMTKKSAA